MQSFFSARQRKSLSLFNLLIVAVLLFTATQASAMPTNPVVRLGSASFAQAYGGPMNINQQTELLVVDWVSFSLSAGQTVNLVQPSSTSVALFRVTNDTSIIDGQVQSNGQIFVINSNGMILGPNSTLNVGGLVASTLNISDSDFAARNYTFSAIHQSLAAVVAMGSVVTGDGGSVVLAAPSVTNGGGIDVFSGNAHLVSAHVMALQFSGKQLVNLEIVGPAAGDAIGVRNSGSISSRGGEVRLTARVASGFVKTVVDNEGIIEAESVGNAGGRIFLDGGENLTVNSGNLAAARGITFHGNGVVVDGRVSSGTQVNLASTGAIAQGVSGAILAPWLSASSADGQTYLGNNDIDSFSATSAGGDLLLENKAPDLTIAGITVTNGGNVGISTYGNLSLVDRINTTGMVVLRATEGTITESGAGAVANASSLSTDSKGSQILNGANSVLSFNGQLIEGTIRFTNSVDVGQPMIFGAAAGSVPAETPYSFTPTASNATGFSISNKPSWASFDTVTGMLSGTPGAGAAGTYSDITITAHKGSFSAALPPFSITVIPQPPTPNTPSFANVGTNIATLLLQGSGTGTGYFTLLSGAGAACGTGLQVKGGQSGGGAPAYRVGSLPLAEGTTGSYTVRNLAQGSTYTVCFTAEGAGGLNPVPVSATLTTLPWPGNNGLAWSSVGTPGTLPGGDVSDSLVFAPDGTPHLAYVQQGVGRITVMKFTNGAWSALGPEGFSSGGAYYPTLVFSPDGVPYVAYSNSSAGGRATVMKYSEGAWTVVGTVGFSAWGTESISLAFAPDGTPFAAFQMCPEYHYQSPSCLQDLQTSVMKYSAGTWTTVGNVLGLSRQWTRISLAFAPDGTPYVAHQQLGAYTSEETHLKKYDAQYNGGYWADVGGMDGLYISGFTPGEAKLPTLAFAPDGTPYVAFILTYNQKASVMKYSAGEWKNVGTPSFSGGGADSLSLAFAPDGTPYLAYLERANGSKVTAMKYSAGTWRPVGAATMGPADSVSLAFAPDGVLYLAYGDYDAGSARATVMKLGSLPTIAGSPPVSATVGTSYSFIPTAEFAQSFSLSGDLPPGLSFSTSTGGISGTPTSAGLYANLVITAVNGLGSASLPAFDLSVQPSSLTLQVSISGTGSGTVTSSPLGIACIHGTVNGCSASFSYASTVSLFATADSNSTFGGWEGACQGAGVCSTTMVGDRSVTATFLDAPKVRIGAAPYLTLQDACTAAGNGDMIRARALEFGEQVVFAGIGGATLAGGYDAAFGANAASFTTIRGSLKIRAGRLNIDKVRIR